MKKASDVMNRELVTLTKGATIQEIVTIMKEKQIGKLPVVENGKILGVVTRDDLLVRKEIPPVQPVFAFWEVLITLPTNHEFQRKIEKLSAYSAEQIMDEDIFTCEPDKNLEELVTLMVELKKDYALVVHENELLGLITKTDLISKCF